MEKFQGPGACLVVEWIIQEGTDDASQEKGQSCLFVLERYREGSSYYCRTERVFAEDRRNLEFRAPSLFAKITIKGMHNVLPFV